MNEDLGSPGRITTLLLDNSAYQYECERCLKGFHDELHMRWVDTKEMIKHTVYTEYRVFYEDINTVEHDEEDVRIYYQPKRIQVCVQCLKQTDKVVFGMTREQRRMARIGARR